MACGKSTFGRVFLCEAPYGGSAKFGKTEFSALTPRQISATVGYLGHDPELSADTVQNNVLCGSEQDAMPWLAAAALNDEVLAMENGLDTVIGPSGTRLSGGQAQRSGTGQNAGPSAPGADPGRPVLGPGPHTEDTCLPICRRMQRIRWSSSSRTGCTTSRRCRKIIFMDGGKTTVGTHAELMASVPVYRQLYESQTGQKEGDLDEE